MFLISIFQTLVPISYPCNVLPGEELMPSEHHCLEDISCTLEQRRNLYSRIDGLCNNLKQPTNGGAGTNFLHLVEKRKTIHKQLKGDSVFSQENFVKKWTLKFELANFTGFSTKSVPN